MLIKFYNHDEKVKRLSKIMRTNSMFWNNEWFKWNE
jgi:hypothetical protein